MDRKIIGIDSSLECTIVKRVNRFVVEILVGGKLYKAYINNTGRLPEYLAQGKSGFCIETKKNGKTDFRLFSIEDGDFGAVIDTHLQMKTFEKALEMKYIPWLEEYKTLKRNVKVGRSLIDYHMEYRGKRVYLEVKSAILRDGKYAMYPDCPSSRGRKHVVQLTDLVKKGEIGIVLFIAALPGVKAFKPNRFADPEMYGLLWEAYKSGVNFKSIGLLYNPKDSFVYIYHPDLEINF